MTKRTRYFLVGAAAVLVFGLCTGLVAYYGGGLPLLSAARTGPAELSYVPASAALVAYADVRDVMTSEFRQRIREIVPQQDREQDAFQKETGIDIERDIDHVVACVMAKEGEDGGMVIARGRFNAAQLETLAREHGGQVSDYKGKRLILTSKLHGQGGDVPLNGKRAGLAFLEADLVALGDESTIRSAIDAAASGQNVTSNAEMMKLVAEIESGANAWAVGRFDALKSHAKLPTEVSSKLPPVKWFAGSGRINGGVSGMIRVEANDEESAKNLRDVVTGLFALARMQSGSDPKIQAALQTLQLSGTGTTVTVTFTVPSEIFDALAKMGKKQGD
jgi:hypothetical protein